VGADVNGDGNVDLIVASGRSSCSDFSCHISQNLSVYLAASAALGNQQIFAQGSSNRGEFGFTSYSDVQDLVTGDFNGDGKLDIVDRRAAGGFLSHSVVLELRLGNGDGTFMPNNQNLDPTFTLPDPGFLWMAQDLNGDQLTDLIVPDSNAIDVLLNATPAFSMVSSATALTAQAGKQVTATLSIAAHNGFSSPIQLSCQVTGSALLPTCSLSPLDIAAGTNSSTSTLTVNVPATSARLIAPPSGWHLWTMYVLGLPFGLLVMSCSRSCAKPLSKCRLRTVGLLTAVLAWSACGAGSNGIHSFSQPSAKSYIIMVMATSDTLTKTLPIPLTTQ
jgi:hypothetical protein